MENQDPITQREMCSFPNHIFLNKTPRRQPILVIGTSFGWVKTRDNQVQFERKLQRTSVLIPNLLHAIDVCISKPEIDPSIILEEINPRVLNYREPRTVDCLQEYAQPWLHTLAPARISVYKSKGLLSTRRKKSPAAFFTRVPKKNTFFESARSKEAIVPPKLETARPAIISRHAQLDLCTQPRFWDRQSPPSPATLFPVSTNPHLCSFFFTPLRWGDKLLWREPDCCRFTQVVEDCWYV